MTLIQYKKLISFLPEHLYAFALEDEDTKRDIIEGKLDQYEIETLVGMNYNLVNKQKKKKITMMLSENTLGNLKIRASELGMPYQTFINSILHQYTTGRLVEPTNV